MRRLLPGVALLGLLLAGCASPQADLQDQVAAVTAAANDGDVTGLLTEAKELELVVERLRDSGDLTAAQATRLRNAAVALQQRAGQVRSVPTPSPTPSPTPEPERTEEEQTPEPEPTTEEPEPVETTEAPEPTREPEPTPKPTEDEPVLPLPTAEQTEASEEPDDEPTASPVAVAPVDASRTPAGRGRRSPAATTSPEPKAA